MILGLIPLLFLAAIVAGVVVFFRRSDDGHGTLRLVMTFTFLLGVLIVAATGVAQLLALAIPEDTIAARGTSETALALALTLVGVPVLVGMWRYEARRLAGPDGQSVVWPIYLSAVTAIFGIGSVIGLISGLAWLFGFDGGSRVALTIGFVWALVWLGHERIRTATHPPRLLGAVPVMIGSTIGLAATAGGAIALLVAALRPAYDTIGGATIAGSRTGEEVGSAAIWLVIGAAVWWWQWLRQGRHATSGIARSLYLLIAGVLGGAVAALGAAGALLYTTLEQLLGDPRATIAAQFSDLPAYLATAGIGFLVWRYHRSVVVEHPEVFRTEVGYAYRHLLAGVGLVAAAVGLGVIINSAIGALAPLAAERGTTNLFLGGLTSLVVGLPVWWLTWRPTERPDQAQLTSKARRIYLTLLAGLGLVVALVSSIIVVYVAFQGALDGDSLREIMDSARTPLGVLLSTALVGWYHGVIWRRDRATLPVVEKPHIRRVTVLATETEEIGGRLKHDLDIPVTSLHHAGDGRVVPPDELTDYLRGLDADEAVVIEEADGFRVFRISK